MMYHQTFTKQIFGKVSIITISLSLMILISSGCMRGNDLPSPNHSSSEESKYNNMGSLIPATLLSSLKGTVQNVSPIPCPYGHIILGDDGKTYEPNLMDGKSFSFKDHQRVSIKFKLSLDQASYCEMGLIIDVYEIKEIGTTQASSKDLRQGPSDPN